MRLAIVSVVLAVLVAVAAVAEQPAKESKDAAKPAASSEPAKAEEAKPAAASGYVGDDQVCAACHEAQFKSYAGTPHATWDKAKPGVYGCESCHGPGQAHVDAGGGKGVGGLMTFADTIPAAERSAPCLRCHASEHRLFDFKGSAHALAGVACTGCHTGHAAAAEPLLRQAQPKLCYGCHGNIRALFLLTEHHKVDEGVMGCADCHQPHGTRNVAMLKSTDNLTCFRCHGDLQGPYVFEHVPQVSEGCVRCHQPHGSVNRHLLIRQQVAQLCYECHTVTPANHIQPSYRDCTRCHVSIHGSNTNAFFLQQ